MRTSAPRPLRVQALWARVDANRVKLGAFVVLFVVGSAALLSLALVAVPGALLVWGAGEAEMIGADAWSARLPWLVLAAFGAMLLVGGLLSAAQLSNAEDWVTNRFQGRALGEGEAPGLERGVSEMALAAGLGQPPRVMVLERESVNALAIGAGRGRPVIGVTSGFLSGLDEGEQRAVVGTLTARIVAGDILFGTALAALMGPLKAIRESRKLLGQGAGCAADGCLSSPDVDGCSDGCGCIDSLGDSDSAGGCLGAIGVALFLALVVAVTYAAVVSAAWIVTLWGRALHRTSHEKADAEGMLLLKDPAPMLSALGKAIRSSNEVADGDASYDGILYAPASGTSRVEKAERRRFDRLREVLGTDGLAAGPTA